MIKITREEIKQKALSLFLERGYSNVTILDICNELNITKPTFYKHVSSKEDLILDLYDSTIDSITSNSYLFIQADSHYEQLLMVFKQLIEETTKYGPDLFSQMLISNLNENRHSIDMRPALTRLCTTIIEQAQKKGEILNTSNANRLYETIAYAFIGYELTWCMYKGDFEWESNFFKSVRDILCVSSQLHDVHLKYIRK